MPSKMRDLSSTAQHLERLASCPGASRGKGPERQGSPVNHYCVRTRAPYALKKIRGLGYFGPNRSHLNRYPDSFFERFNQNVRTNTDIQRYREALHDVYTSFLRIPSVAEAHAAAADATRRAQPTLMAETA